MNTKLTLKLNKKSIERAKRYAYKNGQSLSKLVENYFEDLTNGKSLNAHKFPNKLNEITKDEETRKLVKKLPLNLRRIAGIAKELKDINYKEEITNYLTQKYKI